MLLKERRAVRISVLKKILSTRPSQLERIPINKMHLQIGVSLGRLSPPGTPPISQLFLLHGKMEFRSLKRCRSRAMTDLDMQARKGERVLQVRMESTGNPECPIHP